VRARLLATLAIVVLARPAVAQTGLLVVAHGAGVEWNARVRDVVRQVAWPHGPAAVAFLMGSEAETAGWDQGVAALAAQGATGVVVVPLMVSSRGGHYRQIRYYAGEVDSLPPELEDHAHRSGAAAPLPMRVTPALDGAPELVEAVVERWRGLDGPDRRRPVLLVAHGPNAADDAAAWTADLARVAEGLIRAGSPAGVRAGLLRDDAPPPVRAEAVVALRRALESLAAAAGDSVIVMPVLISSGTINRMKLPRDLEGLPARYSVEPLAPLPQLARWIERVAGAARAAMASEGR